MISRSICIYFSTPCRGACHNFIAKNLWLRQLLLRMMLQRVVWFNSSTIFLAFLIVCTGSGVSEEKNCLISSFSYVLEKHACQLQVSNTKHMNRNGDMNPPIPERSKTIFIRGRNPTKIRIKHLWHDLKGIKYTSQFFLTLKQIGHKWQS